MNYTFRQPYVAVTTLYVAGTMRESLYYCYFYTNVFPLNFAHTLRNPAFAVFDISYGLHYAIFCYCCFHKVFDLFSNYTCGFHLARALQTPPSTVFTVHVIWFKIKVNLMRNGF